MRQMRLAPDGVYINGKLLPPEEQPDIIEVAFPDGKCIILADMVDKFMAVFR